MAKRKNVVGEKRGKLTAISMGVGKDGRSTVTCKCDCGKIKTIALGDFGKGTKSCGCLQKAKGKELEEAGIRKGNPVTDLSGKKFGRWTVLSKAEKRNSHIYWNCICDCGVERVVLAQNLLSRRSTSCGCYNREISVEVTRKRNFRDYDTHTKLYTTWLNMKARCSERGDQYKRYFFRGIFVCDEWKNDYRAFLKWAMANGYNDSLTIDRIDNNKGYCPENCRWTTYQEQGNNKSNNRIIEHNGIKKTMAQWSRELGINYSTFQTRMIGKDSF